MKMAPFVSLMFGYENRGRSDSCYQLLSAAGIYIRCLSDLEGMDARRWWVIVLHLTTKKNQHIVLAISFFPSNEPDVIEMKQRENASRL